MPSFHYDPFIFLHHRNGSVAASDRAPEPDNHMTHTTRPGIGYKIKHFTVGNYLVGFVLARLLITFALNTSMSSHIVWIRAMTDGVSLSEHLTLADTKQAAHLKLASDGST